MENNNIKPHRKKTVPFLSNKQLSKRLKERELAGDILLRKNLSHKLNSLDPNTSLKSLSKGENFLSTKHFGDFMCSILKTKIVSDEHGRIADILLTVPLFDGSDHPGKNIHPMDERHFKTILKLLYEADDERNFTMLCHVAQMDQVKSWFEELDIPGSKYSINVSIWKYSIWAQDAYMALTDENNNPVLCEGVHFPRVDDPTVADDIASQTNKSSLQSYLYFQGGNILDAGDYVLVGKDYIVDNLGRAHLETEEKVIKAFERIVGKPVISLGRKEFIDEDHREHLGGGIFQPVFHIDMYITPTGKRSDSGKPIIFVASPKKAREIVGEESRETDYDIYFDEAAEQLNQYYEVFRMPILPCLFNYKKHGEEVKSRYFLSYNNALIENYDDTSNVFMPTYSQDVESYKNDDETILYEGEVSKRKKLDNAVKAIWESIGYTVYEMDGLEDLALGWGSVHCITKVLARSVEE